MPMLCAAVQPLPSSTRRIDKEAWGFIGTEQEEYRQEDDPEWDEGRGGGPGPTEVQGLLYCHGGQIGAVWDREEGAKGIQSAKPIPLA